MWISCSAGEDLLEIFHDLNWQFEILVFSYEGMTQHLTNLHTLLWLLLHYLKNEVPSFVSRVNVLRKLNLVLYLMLSQYVQFCSSPAQSIFWRESYPTDTRKSSCRCPKCRSSRRTPLPSRSTESNKEDSLLRLSFSCRDPCRPPIRNRIS